MRLNETDNIDLQMNNLFERTRLRFEAGGLEV